MVIPSNMNWLGRIFGHWVIRELAGIIILLAAIVCLPVWVSQWFAIDKIPFQTETPPSGAIPLFVSRGEAREALLATVKGQLGALEQREFRGAWEFAAPGLRQNLPVDDFERMVASGFSIMTSQHEVVIGGVFNNRDLGHVDVKLVSETHGTAFYSYILVAGRTQWFVYGVEALNSEQFESRLPKQTPQ